MKASVKLRPQLSLDPDHPPPSPPFLPLLRLKLPVSLLGLPFLSSFSLSPCDPPSLHLRTLLPIGPSLRLSYHHHHNRHHHPLPSPSFSLSLKLGLGPWGSPSPSSPLTLSALLPLLPDAHPSFLLHFSFHLGHFSFKRSSPLSVHHHHPKENGAGVNRPLPLARWNPPPPPPPVDSGVTVRTSVPLSGHAAVKVRWGVRLPSDAGRPFLTVDKIGIEKVVPPAEKVEKEEREEVRDLWFWIRKEAEELQREQALIREGIEEIRRGIGKL